MDVDQIRRLEPKLAKYIDLFHDCFDRKDTRAHFVLLQLEMEKRHARVIEYLGGVSPMRKPRKSYTPAEKVAILRRHLIDHMPISDICDKYQLPPSIFYAWQKLFFENGASAFERKSGSPEQSHLRTIAALRDKLQRKNEVVAELMEAHIQLKKELGEL